MLLLRVEHLHEVLPLDLCVRIRLICHQLTTYQPGQDGSHTHLRGASIFLSFPRTLGRFTFMLSVLPVHCWVV